MKFNYIKTIQSRFKFLFFFLLLGVIIGITLYTKTNIETKQIINTSLVNTMKNVSTTTQNNIIYHLSIFSTLTILSCFIIGIPLQFILYTYEGISIGYITSSLIHYKKIKGIINSIIIITCNKLIYILLLTYMLYISTNYLKRFIDNKYNLPNIKRYLIKMTIITILILINDTILYYFGNKILNLLIKI